MKLTTKNKNKHNINNNNNNYNYNDNDNNNKQTTHQTKHTSSKEHGCAESQVSFYEPIAVRWVSSPLNHYLSAGLSVVAVAVGPTNDAQLPLRQGLRVCFTTSIKSL